MNKPRIYSFHIWIIHPETKKMFRFGFKDALTPDHYKVLSKYISLGYNIIERKVFKK